MASYVVIFWRDVPSMVEARDDGGTVTRQLSDRFQQLIDSAAMQLGLEGSEAYLEQWRRGDPAERAGSATEVADAVVQEMEEQFPKFIGAAFKRP